MASLKQQCKERFKIAFDSIRSQSTDLTFILVVDDQALKVLSNTIKMMELINYGVNLVEKLELKRKKFSKLDAVYLIHPDSYEKVMEDFEDDDPPQYNNIHILTLTKIGIHIMNEISKSISFTKRVKTLKELNLNFFLHSHNEFVVANDEKDTFTNSLAIEGLDSQILMKKTIDELSTVVTSLSEFYIVQILYSQSQTSEKIAFGVKERLEKLFETYQKCHVENYTSNAPVTTFLILDRAYDAVSPLVKDFHYLPLLYDFKNVRGHKVQGSKDKKILILNEGDEIFEKYKYSHLASTLTGITNDFDSFSSGHIGAKFEKKNQENMKMEEMQEMMKKIPEYTELKDKYSFHMDMITTIMKAYEKKKYKLQGELEQSIITQSNENGKPLKPGDLLKELMEKIDMIPQQEDRARLLLISYMCLDLKAKEKSALVEKISSLSNFDDLYKNVPTLCGHHSYHLEAPRRSSKEENLILDRHQPKLEQTVRAISSGGQADLKYLRVGTEGKSYKSQVKGVQSMGRAKLGGNRKERTAKPRLIVFMGSALGYNEMRSLGQFEKDYQIIFGSHNFVTQNQYLRMINNMVLDEF